MKRVCTLVALLIAGTTVLTHTSIDGRPRVADALTPFRVHFPDELYQAPRSWTERAYPKLIHYNKLDKGGHFAAWEQPQIFAAEMRASFKSLR